MPYSKESTKYVYKHSPYASGFWTHNCVVCGDTFKCNRSTGKYCSQRCANDAAILRRKERTEAKRTAAARCLTCGQRLEQLPRQKIRKYCSTACKQRAYRSRKQAEQHTI